MEPQNLSLLEACLVLARQSLRSWSLRREIDLLLRLDVTPGWIMSYPCKRHVWGALKNSWEVKLKFILMQKNCIVFYNVHFPWTVWRHTVWCVCLHSCIDKNMHILVFVFIYLKGSKREKCVPIDGSFPYACSSWGWSWPMLGAQNSDYSHMESRDPGIEPCHLLLLESSFSRVQNLRRVHGVGIEKKWTTTISWS